ncbi:MAG: bile acid:sodium symporter [Methanotrichaceae archaeon]
MFVKAYLKLLKDTSLIFAVSIILGFILPGAAKYTEPLVTPALIVMMTFSLTEIDFRTRGDLRGALYCFAMNYVLLSGLILLLSYALPDEKLRFGLVVMAAVPPAIAVMPLTRLLGGDLKLSLYGEVLCYIASIILIPGLIFVFASKSGVDLRYVFEITLLTILLPIFISRLRHIKQLKLDPVLPINAGFFLINYTVIGLNMADIFEYMQPMAVIAFARTFLIGTIIYLLARFKGVDYSKGISYTLFSSYKNLGLAAAISITLFGHEASIPIAVCILGETMFYIFLSLARNRAILI